MSDVLFYEKRHQLFHYFTILKATASSLREELGIGVSKIEFVEKRAEIVRIAYFRFIY